MATRVVSRVNVGGEGTVEIRVTDHVGPEEQGHLVDLYHTTTPDDLLFLPEDLTRSDIMQRWEASVEANGGVTVLAYHNGRIVGHAAVYRPSAFWLRHVGEIDLVISPSYRGKGVGTALATALVAEAARTGCERLIVDMQSEQAGALSMFEKLGFVREGLRKAHARDRDGKKHDMVLMAKALA